MASQIAAAGGRAETAQVDALDEQAVARLVEAVVDRAGSLDVSVNAVGIDNGEQGIPLIELSAEEYGLPIEQYTRTQFVTAKAAAWHMKAQGSGVILSLSIPLAGRPVAFGGCFGQAFAAIENLARQLAAELGPHGIRVVCLRPTGVPETAAHLGSHIRGIWGRAAERLGVPFERFLDMVADGSALQRPLTVDDIGGAATLLASDQASGITATVANVSGGAVAD